MKYNTGLLQTMTELLSELTCDSNHTSGVDKQGMHDTNYQSTHKRGHSGTLAINLSTC